MSIIHRYQEHCFTVFDVFCVQGTASFLLTKFLAIFESFGEAQCRDSIPREAAAFSVLRQWFTFLSLGSFKSRNWVSHGKI